MKILSNKIRVDHRREYSECKHKKGFTTTKQANQQIKRTLKTEGIKLNYYQCTYCGKYHLTKKWVKNKFKS